MSARPSPVKSLVPAPLTPVGAAVAADGSTVVTVASNAVITATAPSLLLDLIGLRTNPSLPKITDDTLSGAECSTSSRRAVEVRENPGCVRTCTGNVRW
jgi:hypothetical protein